ncbi:DNA replication helicase/nuclease 2 [Carabus blaptoides fortunei]
MKKNAVSKSKKDVTVNNGQKISSFFPKLSTTTSRSVTSSSNVFWDDTSDDFKEPTTAQTIAKSSITLKAAVKKSSPKKQTKSTRASKKKSLLKAAKPVASTAKSTSHKKLLEDKVVASDSDSDFALDKKVNVVNNLLAAFKSKHKFIYDKTSKESAQNAVKTVQKVTEKINDTKGKNMVVKNINCESESANKCDDNVITVDLDSNNELALPINNVKSTNLIKQTEAISPGGDVNSQLIIDPNDSENVQTKISPNNNRIFDVTSEITYLQRDEILADITTGTNLPNSRSSLNVLYTNISFKKSDRSTSPLHSTPSEICKKRKLERADDSPDVIPSTPEETVTDKSVNRKGKSKMCIQHKFSKYAHPLLVGKYNTDDYVVPDMVVKSPPLKKIRATEHGKVMNLTDIKAHELDQILELSLTKSSSTAKVAGNIKLVPEKCENVTKKCDISVKKCHNAIENIVPVMLDSDSDDFVTRKPRKSPKNSNNLVKSTSKFIVSPAKNISPSKNSPHKGIVLKMPFSPTKSGSKSKRSLFHFVPQNDDVHETNNEKNPVFANDDIKVTTSPLKTKLDNGPLNDFTHVSSSKDESNIILSRKSLSPKKAVVDENVDDFDYFNFDDGWDEELNNIEQKLDELNLETWQYCKVMEVTKDLQQNIILKLQAIETKQETHCMLQGMWTSTRLQIGDTINILATKSTSQIPFAVNNNVGYVIYEPDMLISSTSIVGAQFCKRRGILADKFRGTDPGNKVMLVGTLVHSLLQEVLKQKIYSVPLIEKKLVEILDSKEIVYKSFAIQIPIQEIKDDLLAFIPKIVTFINKYVKNDNKTNRSKAIVKNQTDDWTGSIQSIQDIEENIWSPQYGIKGKIDVTIQARPLGAFLPLELKTGRATMSLEHKGQLIIYVMLMTELGYQVNSGLLLYLREDTIKEVKTTHDEKRDLIMLRNDVAYYLKQIPKVPIQTQDIESVNSDNESDNSKSLFTILAEDDPMKSLIMSELPEPISHRSACQKCPYATICTIYLSRDTTSTVSDQHPLKELSTELLAHLESAHIDYFMHWTSLINVENNYQPPIKELKHIWRLKPYEREQRGKSLAYLKLVQSVQEENDTYKHTFVRSTDDSVKILMDNNLKLDLLKSGLVANNYVVVSTDVRSAIATGFVTEISQEQIEVNLERNLTERYFNKTFHIDSYESQTLSNFCMTSIAELLAQSERAKRLRELIIDKKPSVIMGKLSKNIMNIGGHILKQLNKIQQRAVLLALTIKDYLLIKGMPGTGKTATVVALIQLLVQLKKTVLITSHTHSAVDNVCLRLLDCGVDVLRLGSEHRVHPRLKSRTEGALTSHCKTVDELKQVYNTAQVVAVTCLAAAHPIFTYRTLDVCIVDESTQVLQCSLIKTLLSTSSFILIGDPDQLPPVVKNPEAMCRGMSESLFERLDNPSSTVTLTLQYRMNKVITELANAVTYHGHLLCADDSIGFAVLDLPEIQRLQSVYNKEQWILNVLDTKIENSVIALDTGPTWNILGGAGKSDDNLLAEIQVPSQNVSEDEERKCSNLHEAGVVVSLIEALKQAGVPSEEIGIIAPYRAQVGLLRRLVANITDFDCSAVEMNTVDQYQGRDKDVIIYSCTKSRKASKTKTVSGYEILEDKRRLTVAITRAKHKLIIIGDFLTLKTKVVSNLLYKHNNSNTVTQFLKFSSADSKTDKSECSSNNNNNQTHRMQLNLSDTNVDQSEYDTVDQSRTRKYEVTNVSALYKLCSKTNKSDSKDFDPVIKDKNISLLHKQVVNSSEQLKIELNSNMASANVQNKVSPERSVVKQKLTSSISLILESNSARSSKVVQLRKKSLSPKRSVYNNNEFNLASVSTLKITDREKRFSTKDTPLVKELIQNLSNKEHESLLNEHKENTAVKLPEYAQVVKLKKKEITTTGNTDISLTDTLKAALKQPLPMGPPPKKPPRTFAHTPNSKQKIDSRSDPVVAPNPQPIADSVFCSKLNENLAQGFKTASESAGKPAKLKSDPKLMLQKLENALLSNRIRSPKLPKKIKSSPSKSCTTSPQHGPQLNFYSPELPHKTLFPDCLPSLNCAKAGSMNNYAKIVSNKPSTSSMSTFFTDCKDDTDEPIYAEPFEHEEKVNFGLKRSFFKTDQRDRRADTLSNSLHYMSNPVCAELWNQADVSTSTDPSTDNSVLGDNDVLTSHKLNLIMNHTYATPNQSDTDSLASTPSSDDAQSTSSRRSTIKDLIRNFEQNQDSEAVSLKLPVDIQSRLDKCPSRNGIVETREDIEKGTKENEETVGEKKKFKAQLNRTLTEIRKSYVRKVCSTLKKKADVKTEETLFECCMLVGLNLSTLTPYIKKKYPETHQVPQWIEHLCFPDATEWTEKSSSAMNARSQDYQCYSLVITNEKGDRKFGYCRRVLPEEASVCLPLTYCIISKFRAAGFYHKVLQELESRHGLPFWLQNAFVRELYNTKFPQPGENVKVSCLLRTVVVNSCEEMMKNQQIKTPESIECVKRIINMQNGVYGSLNKMDSDDRSRMSDISEADWYVCDDNGEQQIKSDFRIPKNTYGTLNRTDKDVPESSFTKISNYASEYRRCISDTNASAAVGEQVKLENTSFVHQLIDRQNSRSSEPQINKRVGQIFDDFDVKSCETEGNKFSDSSRVISSEFGDFCNTPLLNLPNSQLMHDCLLGDVLLKRPYDSRLEDVDLRMLFNTLDLQTLLQTFGSLLHERKVIFVSSCLSKLSSCIEALQSILYPFSWQHTFIPALSNQMLDILSAPLPLIAGVLAAHYNETIQIEDGIAVNLDTSKVLWCMNDENQIIPKRLRNGLTIALQLVTEATAPEDSSRNVLVSEAFIRMFVEACGCYRQYISVDEAGTKIFERDDFIKHHRSKCVKLFLEWFSETAMFHTFIQTRLDGTSVDKMFEERCIELNCEKNSAALLKNIKVSQKMKHFGHKLFH